MTKIYCVIIPTYNNCKTLGEVITGVLRYTDNIIVVNDGSTDETEHILKKNKKLHIISYPDNKGKGFALRKGFELAREKGYEYAITIDSDGQHSPDDIPAFIDKLKNEPEAIIIGARNMNRENIPGKSSFGHKFSNFWFRFETGIKLPDTQSGFRLYPLKSIENIRFFTKKFEFEIEVIVRSAWKGVKITSVPINVFYATKEERVSHFRPIRDFIRVSILNSILVFIAVVFIKPFRFLKHLNKQTVKEFIKNNLLYTKDSDIKIVLSVMLGIFMGIVPVWGYQLIIAIMLAFVLRLNKLIVIVAANISIPPMIPVILYLSYITGGLILNNTDNNNIEFSSGITLEFVKDNLIQYIVGSFIFAIILSLSFGLFTYIFLKLFRKKRMT
jgi:glycosyltransferase involved in cell wall biosynthesis